METNYKDIITKANQALAENDTDVFVSFCTDETTWTMVGEERVKGKKAILEFLAPMKAGKPSEIEMYHTIQEGNMVASTGLMKMPDGISAMSFCDVYRFEGDKFREIISYIVELKDGKKVSA